MPAVAGTERQARHSGENQDHSSDGGECGNGVIAGDDQLRATRGDRGGDASTGGLDLRERLSEGARGEDVLQRRVILSLGPLGRRSHHGSSVSIGIVRLRRGL
jgi:hypothetical protein